jgi:hypothetical protein
MGELEEKFHSHFYTSIHGTRLSHLASVRQGRDESILILLNDLEKLRTDVFI